MKPDKGVNPTISASKGLGRDYPSYPGQAVMWFVEAGTTVRPGRRTFSRTIVAHLMADFWTSKLEKSITNFLIDQAISRIGRRTLII
jgi:hypothetical protein